MALRGREKKDYFYEGGGGFARVFAGVSAGYRATDKAWTPEDVLAHFDEAMQTDRFFTPDNAMDESSAYASDAPWDAFRAYIT